VLSDFAAIILTHGRPDRVVTYNTLRKAGYTGRIVILIDDEDKTADEYRKRYGSIVETFSKADIATRFDEGDNIQDRRVIVYARNASFEVAKRLGIRYFIQLDDDYQCWEYRFQKDFTYRARPIKSLDKVFEQLLKFYKNSFFASIAMGQGGDYIGGSQNPNVNAIKIKRKAMNTFICDTERPFKFVGRINEDVNTYTCEQRRGLLFATVLGVSIVQKQTQSNAGGMTDIYKDNGTYLKTFFSVMYAPSCVKVSVMGDSHMRIHHKVKWKNATPLILRQTHKRAS